MLNDCYMILLYMNIVIYVIYMLSKACVCILTQGHSTNAFFAFIIFDWIYLTNNKILHLYLTTLPQVLMNFCNTGMHTARC